MTEGLPHPSLRTSVLRYCGYRERPTTPLVRRQLPGPSVTVIIGFGDAIRVSDPRQAAAPLLFRSFVAGLSDCYALTETAGDASGVQIDFTPLGAYSFLGLSMDSVANRVVTLDDVFGSAASRLVEELEEASDWTQRFALLDCAIGDRIAAARTPSTGVAWAWGRLVASGGRMAIGAIAGELRWSNRRLIERFREELGLPPKIVARLIRFDRVVRTIRSGRRVRWGALANDCGYHDQAHFVREFVEFSGGTPSDWEAFGLQGRGSRVEGRGLNAEG